MIGIWNEVGMLEEEKNKSDRKLSKNTRSGAVGWGTALQAGRSRRRFPMESLEFFFFFRLHYGPGSTEALTEMSTRTLSWG